MRRKITPEYLASQGLSENFPERFWAKVRKTESCWIWTGAKLYGGYGRIKKELGWSKTKNISAHIASWILHYGPVPRRLCVLHDCPNGDRPDCVNPHHLWVGTNGDNSKDMTNKGRSSYGEKNGTSKLNESQVKEILSRHIRLSPRNSNSLELAKEFGVSLGHINQIARGDSWKHISRRDF